MVVLKRKAEKLMQTLFSGEVTCSKTHLWLVGIICVLAGIVYGMCVSGPWAHGVTIGSFNGNTDNSHGDLDQKSPEETEKKEKRG